MNYTNNTQIEIAVDVIAYSIKFASIIKHSTKQWFDGALAEANRTQLGSEDKLINKHCSYA